MSDLRSSVVAATIEERILADIADVSRQISDLTLEKSALERMLYKARQQNELIKRTDVTRKNSRNRVLVEGSILQSLKTANRAVRAGHLYADARFIIGNLRENTLRSILHRMKNRGTIVSASKGSWRLPAPDSKQT